MKRRLAAIIVADVVGFSSMMEADEEGTAARMAACRNIAEFDIMGPASPFQVVQKFSI